MTCPTCRQPVDEQGPHRPFCSERCKTIDLGRWAAEEHVISTPLTSEGGLSAAEDEDT